MNIQIHSVHFSADKNLEGLIYRKLSKVETFFRRITDTEVFLKLDHNGGVMKDKIAEIRMHIPGKTLYAEQRSKLFEESVELAADSIVRQAKKYKEKIQG
jgi:putative sigma-54 modulation protein